MYSIILTTHILTALVLIGTVLYTDHVAFNWIRGKTDLLPKKKMHRIHYGIYGGLSVMMITGLYMFLPIREFLLYEPAFQIKMGLLATLIVNSFYIKKLMDYATQYSFTELSSLRQLVFFAGGGISTACWVGILVAATQLGV